MLGEESHNIDFRCREKLGRELQSEKEGGEASGFGRRPGRGSRGLNVEMILRLVLGRRNEASVREGRMPAGRRAVERGEWGWGISCHSSRLWVQRSSWR